MSSRAIDPCWEALVQETQANPAVERGVLNRSLKAIREAAFHEGLIGEDAVAEEIHLRAAAYRRAMPGCMVTPMALAKHWCRVMTQGNGSVVAPAPTAQQLAFQQARMSVDA